jgi:hypothetical protein
MDEDIKIDVSDHVEEVNSLRVRMTAERQQELLSSEARERLRNHAILRRGQVCMRYIQSFQKCLQRY